MNEYDYLIKIVIIGDHNTGKSSLCLKHRKDLFKDEYTPTIGAEFYSKIYKHNGKNVKLQIWDKGNDHPKYTSAFYYGSETVIILIDLSKKSSLLSIEKWYIESKKYVKSTCNYILVGSKNDLDMEISKIDIDECIKKYSFINYFSISSLNGNGIELLFNYIVNLDNTNDIQLENINLLEIDTKKGNIKKCCILL